WLDYQDAEQQIEQQVNNNRTTTEQQVNTNKNVKNLKNEKNVKKVYSEVVKLSDPEYEKLLKKYGSEESLNQGIEILNNYIQAKQPKYKSHYHVMIGWV